MLNKLDGVQLELLRTFVIVGSARTFAEAAGRRHVTVSAVSQQIRALESQLGFALFERHGRRAVLTEEGRLLHQALESELDRLDEIVGEAAERATRVRGRVALGSPRTFGAYWLRPRLQRLLSRYAELELSVEFGTPAELERRLVARELDLALLARPAESPGIVEAPVVELPIVAVASPAYLDRCGELASLADFQRQAYLLFDYERSMHSLWWRAAFGAQTSGPERFLCQIRSIEELCALAEAGLGIAIVPEFSVEAAIAAGRLCALRVGVLVPRLTVSLGWRAAAIETARFSAVRAELLAGDEGDGSNGAQRVSRALTRPSSRVAPPRGTR